MLAKVLVEQDALALSPCLTASTATATGAATAAELSSLLRALQTVPDGTGHGRGEAFDSTERPRHCDRIGYGNARTRTCVRMYVTYVRTCAMAISCGVAGHVFEKAVKYPVYAMLLSTPSPATPLLFGTTYVFGFV